MPTNIVDHYKIKYVTILLQCHITSFVMANFSSCMYNTFIAESITFFLYG